MLSCVQPGTLVTLVAPSGGVTGDVPVKIGGLVVIPVADAEEGALFAAYLSGVFKLAKVDGVAFLAGRWLKWDVSAGECVLNATATADFNVGRVRKAVGTTDTEVELVVEDRLRRSHIAKMPITDVSAASDSALETAPFDGLVTRVFSKLLAAITVADANLTPKIGATAITGAALVIAYTGSAVGDVDEAFPTALNVVAKGDTLVASSGGESTTSAGLNVYYEIEEL